MNAWAAAIPRAYVDMLLPLRDLADVRVADDGEWFWVHGPGSNEKLDQLLCGIPQARRFRVRADGWLTPVEATLPTGKLPPLAWGPLRERLTLLFPESAELRSRHSAGPSVPASGSVERTAVRLVRASPPTVSSLGSAAGSAAEQAAKQATKPANVVLTTVADWCAFVERSPRATWENTDFAADARGRCIVRVAAAQAQTQAANALAVRGERWREDSGIATPLGWRWAPAIDSRILHRMWLLADGDLALWFPDEHVERIEAAWFARTSRSAVRETRRRLLSGGGQPLDGEPS
jgi:hypothetical protein